MAADFKNLMTIGHLRALLKHFPQDMPVFVDGYENGFTPVSHKGIKQRKLHLDDGWCDVNIFGSYREVSEGENARDEIRAVVLSRKVGDKC